MSFPDDYLLNVALHAGVLSLAEMPADRLSGSVRFRVRPKPDGERHLLLLEVDAVE